MRQRLVIGGLVFFCPCLGREPNRHRRTKHRQAVLQHDDPLFMQKHQRSFDRGVDVFYFCSQKQVLVERAVQFFKVEFDQVIRHRGRLGRDLGHQRVEDHRRQPAPLFRQRDKRRPVSTHPDAIRIARDKPQLDAPVRAGKAPPVLTEALQQ